MVTDQHGVTGTQIKHSTLSDRIRERRSEHGVFAIAKHPMLCTNFYRTGVIAN